MNSVYKLNRINLKLKITSLMGYHTTCNFCLLSQHFSLYGVSYDYHTCETSHHLWYNSIILLRMASTRLVMGSSLMSFKRLCQHFISAFVDECIRLVYSINVIVASICFLNIFNAIHVSLEVTHSIGLCYAPKLENDAIIFESILYIHYNMGS